MCVHTSCCVKVSPNVPYPTTTAIIIMAVLWLNNHQCRSVHNTLCVYAVAAIEWETKKWSQGKINVYRVFFCFLFLLYAYSIGQETSWNSTPQSTVLSLPHPRSHTDNNYSCPSLHVIIAANGNLSHDHHMTKPAPAVYGHHCANSPRSLSQFSLLLERKIAVIKCNVCVLCIQTNYNFILLFLCASSHCIHFWPHVY